jgi:hypothetical protein
MSELSTTDERDQKIADLERELKWSKMRVEELKFEVDGNRQTMRAMEEWIQERDSYLEEFILSFGLELGDDDIYRNGEFLKRNQQIFDDYNALAARYNKLVRRFNANIAAVQPVGRPIAASPAQQLQILKFHKAGRSSRRIAEEMTLSRRTVLTVIDKNEGTDRTTNQRRLRLGLEPKRKDWRQAAIANMPRRATALHEQAKDLLKEAKGLK